MDKKAKNSIGFKFTILSTSLSFHDGYSIAMSNQFCKGQCYYISSKSLLSWPSSRLSPSALAGLMDFHGPLSIRI